MKLQTYAQGTTQEDLELCIQKSICEDWKAPEREKNKLAVILKSIPKQTRRFGRTGPHAERHWDYDDDGWLRSQTLLVIAGIKEAALHSVVETAEVHDLELLLWLLLLQQLAESEWETLMAPMAAIGGILNIED